MFSAKWPAEPSQQRGGILQAAGIIDELLKIKTDADGLRHAAGFGTGLRGLGHLLGLFELVVMLGEAGADSGFNRLGVHGSLAPRNELRSFRLGSQQKSSPFASSVWISGKVERAAQKVPEISRYGNSLKATPNASCCARTVAIAAKDQRQESQQ